jgi:hypothetical protein
MATSLYPRWQKRLVLWASLGLALTGMGQMPIFARYGIATLPGLHWLGDFRMTAALHLGLAAVLLVVLAQLAVTWLGSRRLRPRLSGVALARVALFAALAATGLVRVLQNGSQPPFGPLEIRYLDWSHLGLAVALGIAALLPAGKPGQA